MPNNNNLRENKENENASTISLSPLKPLKEELEKYHLKNLSLKGVEDNNTDQIKYLNLTELNKTKLIDTEKIKRNYFFFYN